MGIGLKGNSALLFGIKLEKTADKTTRALRRVNEQAAKEMAEVASEMAPELTGELSLDVSVVRQTETSRRSSYTVGHLNPPRYAVYMHEGVYNLGPYSREKQAKSRHRVGRKYIERAAHYIIHDWDLYGKARKAIRENHK